MWIFIFNYITIPIYNFLFKEKKYFITVVACQLFLLIALSDLSIGADTLTYSDAFSVFSKAKFQDLVKDFNLLRGIKVGSYRFEPGYVFLNWILGKCGFSFRMFLILYAAFCIISVTKFIDQYSQDACFSFCLFLALGMYGYYFGIIRQSIAVSILLFSINSIKKRQIFKFFILVFIAFLFHKIALIFLPFYFVANIKLTKKTYEIHFFLWVVELLCLPIVINRIVLPIMEKISKGHYVHLDIQHNYLIVAMLIVAILAYFFINFDTFFQTKENMLACWGMLLAIYMELIGLYVLVLARAVISIYFIFVVVLVPNVIKAYPNKKIAIAGKTAILVLSLLFLIRELPDSYLIPYKFFFQ